MSGTGLLLCIGILFHIVYLFSIFDIYFKSPLVHGMTPHRSPLPAPADRLVLFVGKSDGLRADKIIESDGQHRAPFLRDIMRQKGTWGVSHTRVPTESRPGHVAIIAGFYEDVSAVTTGWTMNPVNFDSVFNQSAHTWSFGSPDILPMFHHGATDPSRVETFMYPPEYEDFSGEASHLDTWVFDHVKRLFGKAKHDTELNRKLRQKKIVFFLHLLGLDTNGHGFRPHSKEYHDNIRLVDEGIAEIVALLEEFYGHDGRTSYIFTADHGMNNRGAHGDGHPDNTRTPLVAWGAGIHGPRKTALGHDAFSRGSDLIEFQRDDVEQADIAPLMATLIGIDLPVNSVGVLPLAYLGGDEQFRAEAAFANAREILAQLQVQHDRKEKSELFFRPFAPLADPSNVVGKIQEHMNKKEYVLAEDLSKELIQLCLRGLRYFQTYDWLFLRSVITAGYVGWCVYCMQFVIRHHVLSNVSMQEPTVLQNQIVDGLSVLAFVILGAMVWTQHMPTIYYAYVFFPVYFWNQIVRNKNILAAGFRIAAKGSITKVIISSMGILGVIEAFTYSFFQREVLSVLFVLAACWPLAMHSRTRREHPRLLCGWAMACIATSLFTLLPVEKGEDISLVIAGGALGIGLASALLYKLESEGRVNSQTALLMKGQLLVNLISDVLVYSSSQSLQRREGLPVVNQWASWIVISGSTLFPFLYRGSSHEDYLARLLMICSAFGPLMTLLSISYEMLFYVCFCTTVLLWLETERAQYRDARGLVKRPLQERDILASLFFLFFILVAFFGTGNVASLSSFSIESVYRFITVFSPFLMGALLITKILIPFFVVSAVLGVLNDSFGLESFSLFLIVMTVSDIQTINFFYLVTDYGSWLEIGTGISHFCISELFIIFSIILFLLSRLLVGHLAVREAATKKLY